MCFALSGRCIYTKWLYWGVYTVSAYGAGMTILVFDYILLNEGIRNTSWVVGLKGIRCAHMDTCLRRYDEKIRRYNDRRDDENTQE